VSLRLIIALCRLGIVIWSVIPSSFVFSTATIPSSLPGSGDENIGLNDLLPAIVPKS